MEIPAEVAVMTLPHVTLFPQSLLPLYIFEPRYRRMLADTLSDSRMFVVAMQKPGRIRETPSRVAGLGLIRVGVDNSDGSSHVILQGITRVELLQTIRYKPYRVAAIRPLQAPACDNVAIDALVAKVRDLVNERVQLGLHSKKSSQKAQKQPSILTIKDVVNYLKDLEDGDQVADLVSCTLLPGAAERQRILETVDVVPRLKHLIHFLIAEIKAERKNKA
ncbi:MAG: LON peptidase substrate-binding domain-containing protein [Limisphaerales bacterium]